MYSPFEQSGGEQAYGSLGFGLGGEFSSGIKSGSQQWEVGLSTPDLSAGFTRDYSLFQWSQFKQNKNSTCNN
jgi:hypothetical protein